MQVKNLSFTVLFAFCCVQLTAQGQQPVEVPVTIQVTDPTGASIPNARIELIQLPTSKPTEATTDAQGKLALGLKQGGYCAAFSSPGFRTLGGHIRVQGPITIPAKLDIGGCTECVEVYADDGNTLGLLALPYRQSFMTPSELKAMKHTLVVVHNTRTKEIERYSGVPLFDLLGQSKATEANGAGEKPPSSFIVARGVDGTKAVLALAEIEPNLHPAGALVADTLNGKPLVGSDGPFMLVVATDKYPGRTVPKLVSIEVRAVE